MDKLRAAEAARTGQLTAGATHLHRQISDELRRQIDAGELRPGDSLPSEYTLVGRYGVSRGTVRQALATLRADGMIGGSQGKQLTVREPHLTQSLGELISFSNWARSLGKRPSGSVVSFEQRPADAELATRLGIAAGSVVHQLVRVRLADDEPLMIERTVFPAAIGELLGGVDLDHESVYTALGRRGVVFASARHTISAIPAAATDARLLRVTSGTPLLRIFRQGFSLSGEPLEWSDDRYLADRVDFTIENTAHDAGMARRLERSGSR